MKGSFKDDALKLGELAIPTGSPQRAQLRASSITYNAVVLDAKLRQSLTTVRSLGRRGKQLAALEIVSALSKSKQVPTFSSRWCQLSSIIPTYEQQAEQFLGAVKDICDYTGARVLISSADGTIAVLRQYRTEIEQWGLKLALAQEDALDAAINKARTLAIAEQLGLNVPRGVPVTSVSEVAEAIHAIGLPAVIKPTMSWQWGQQQGARLTCKLVTTPEEACLAVEQLTCFGGSVLFQQFLSGRQESISLFYAHGEIYARFAQWTRRAHPPLGGVSTYRQSIALPEDAGEQAERLVRAIELEGYAQVQFRRDSAGNPYLMEINPRLTSGIEIAVRAGIDFPYLVYQWANGERIDRPNGYRSGVRMRYLEGDLLTTLQMFCEQGRPEIPPPGRATYEFLATFFAPTGYDYLDWQDFGPTWTASREMFDHLWYRLKTRS